MEAAKDYLKSLRGIHGKVAADVWQPGMVLHCLKCGRSETLTRRAFAQYLASGWPKCCDQTMLLMDE